MIQDKILTKNNIVSIGQNLLLLAIIIVCIRGFKIHNPFYIAGLIVLFIVAIDIYKKQLYISWKYIYKLLKTYSTIYLFYYILLFSGLYGIIGLVVVVLLYSFYKLYTGRKLLLTGIRDIETRLFGKPLDKELWREEKCQKK